MGLPLKRPNCRFQFRSAHPNSRFKTIGESILFGAAAVAATADHVTKKKEEVAKTGNGKQHPGLSFTNVLPHFFYFSSLKHRHSSKIWLLVSRSLPKFKAQGMNKFDQAKPSHYFKVFLWDFSVERTKGVQICTRHWSADQLVVVLNPAKEMLCT